MRGTAVPRRVGRGNGSLAHSPGRFAERHLGPRTAIPGLFLTGQDVATCGIAGAAMGGLLAATAVAGRNVMGEVLGS
jgi:all-trans-retinol 13,14-reductase